MIDELSFLAMECACLGAAEAGGRILQQYCQAAGDEPPAALVSFYMSYRACVRAKVNAIRSQQTSGAEQEAARKTALKYLALADHYAAELGGPWLVVVRGLSGTGKSTLAAALADSLGIEHLNTDGIRREMFEPRPSAARYDEATYSRDNRQAVYDEMLRRAGELLESGLSVVLDGTFLAAKLRSEAASLARRHEAAPFVVHCECPKEIALERITARQAAGKSLSEARTEFYDHQREEEEPDPPGFGTCLVDTTSDVSSMLAGVFSKVKRSFGENQYFPP